MVDGQQRLLSGIKPTGTIHLGNYFGAMEQFVNLQSEYESFLFIADYHALTTNHDPTALRDQSRSIAAAYLTVGLDPQQVTLFRQSDIAEHTELAWIFNCITTVSYLQRAHAYKAAQEGGAEVSVGTFDYPMLMAADILMYNSAVVPVGSDQKQHIEFARDTAQVFNTTFGETFRLPEPLILEARATVPGIDGRKMSKSYGNTIPLFGSNDEIRNAIASIVTDSKGVDEPKDPDTDTIMSLVRYLADTQTVQELEQRYRHGGIGYKEVKDHLTEATIAFVQPLRERYHALLDDPEHLDTVLAAGADRARTIADETMQLVRHRVGVRA